MKSFLFSTVNRSETTKLFYSFFIAAILSVASLSATTITAVSNGNWSATGTWSPAQVPVAGDDVIIPSPYNVTVDGASGGTYGNCKTIDIQSGGTLTLGTNYISPTTSLTCNGTLSASTNAARINTTGTTGGATITIYGTFSTTARLQVTSTALNKVVIDANANVTVNTIGMAGGTLQIDGTLTLPTTASTVTISSGTVTVNGTLNVNGSTFQIAGTLTTGASGVVALTPGTAASATLTTNNATGSITIGTLNLTSNTGSGSVNIGNGAAGSTTITTCNISGTGTTNLGVSGTTNTPTVSITTCNISSSGSVNFGTTTSTSTPTINITTLTNNASNNVTFNQYATYGTISNLTMNTDISSRNLNLNKNVAINNLTMTTGRIKLNANNVVLTVNNSITGGSATSFIYTTTSTITGTKVRCSNISTAGITVPLGGTRYYPVTVTPTATADISISVAGQIGQTGYPTDFTTAAIDLTKTVQAEYNVTNNSGSAATVTLTLGYGASDYGSAYSATNPKGVARLGGSWSQISNGTAGATSATVTNEVIPATTSYYYGISADGGLSGIVLPVEWQSFTAKANGKTNILTWATTTEKEDNVSFQIERSANGMQFQSIGAVKETSTTNTEQHYTFTDDNPLSISYYRLRQTDVNGSEILSKTVTVTQNKTAFAKVYPSVADNMLNIETNEIADRMTLTVTDMTGRVLIQQQAQNTSSYQMDIRHLAAGLYVLGVEILGKNDILKFIKQ